MRSPFAAIALVLCLSFFPCAAAAGAPIGPGLDLVVLVDRSDSMREHPISKVLLHLIVDIVARSGESARLRHRVAVIGFGTTVSVEVAPAFAGPQMSRGIDEVSSASRGETDVLAALAASEAMLRSLGAGTERRRAIVLLTDGVAYVRGTNMRTYAAALRRFAGTHFGRGDPTLDVLLLSSPAGSRYLPLWRELSFDRVHVIDPDTTSLLAEAHRVTTRLAGTSSAEGLPSKVDDTLETLLVPPYLDLIVLDVIRSTPSARVEVFPPGAQHPLRGGAGSVENVGAGDALSTLVVHRPAAGVWVIRKSRSDAHVRVLSQQFFPRGLLVRPALTDALRQHDRVQVIYTVIDPNGRPLHELPDYQLALDLAFVKPDGAVETVPMVRRGELEGTAFAAVRESECAVAGRYWTSVGVTSVDAAGRRVEIFRDRWSGFSVEPAAPVDCRAGATARRWSSRVDVRVECVDGDRRPVEASSFATGTPERLFRPLLTRGETHCDALLDLRYVGGGAWRGVLHGAARTGQYRLRLEVERALLRPAHNVRLVPAAMTFQRDGRGGSFWLAVAALAAVAAAAGVKQTRRGRVPSA